MRDTTISRRDFLKGLVLTAGTTILVSCAPGKSSSFIEEFPLDAEAMQNGGFKFLVAYDSVYGNTKQIAEALIDAVEGDYGVKILHASEVTLGELENVSLVVIGSPTYAGTYTDPIKELIAKLPANSLEGIKAITFDTSFERAAQTNFMKTVIDVFGYASLKIAKKLEKKGAVIIASETFIVLDTEGPLKDGEIDRAKTWFLNLLKAV